MEAEHSQPIQNVIPGGPSERIITYFQQVLSRVDFQSQDKVSKLQNVGLSRQEANSKVLLELHQTTNIFLILEAMTLQQIIQVQDQTEWANWEAFQKIKSLALTHTASLYDEQFELDSGMDSNQEEVNQSNPSERSQTTDTETHSITDISYEYLDTQLEIEQLI